MPQVRIFGPGKLGTSKAPTHCLLQIIKLQERRMSICQASSRSISSLKPSQNRLTPTPLPYGSRLFDNEFHVNTNE